MAFLVLSKILSHLFTLRGIWVNTEVVMHAMQQFLTSVRVLLNYNVQICFQVTKSQLCD